MFGDCPADEYQIAVDRVAVQPSQRCDLHGSQVERKELEELAELALEIFARTNCLELTAMT